MLTSTLLKRATADIYLVEIRYVKLYMVYTHQPTSEYINIYRIYSMFEAPIELGTKSKVLIF